MTWQYRKFYGPSGLTDAEGWAPWEDVEEGVAYYSPRTLLQDVEALGKIEFRVKPLEQEPKGCEVCGALVEDMGLCEVHLNEELEFYNSSDLWPDFHDEPIGWLDT